MEIVVGAAPRDHLECAGFEMIKLAKDGALGVETRV
jgi:hypothetical protein